MSKMARGIYCPIIREWGGGIKPVPLKYFGEENLYLRKGVHIFTQTRGKFYIYGEIIAQKCNKK